MILMIILSGIFFISVSPFSDWASRFWQNVQENTLPGVTNTVREVWRILGGGSSAITGIDGSGITLPQPDWRTRFELMWTSLGFTSLMQSTLIAFIPFLLAFWSAAYYFQYIHKIPRFRSAFAHLVRMILPIPPKRMRFENGYWLQKGGNLSLERIGGPARINLDKSTAAVFEKSDGTSQVILPGQERVPIEGYEQIRIALDMRPEELTLTVSERTRDGILLQARQARFSYKLYLSTGAEGIDPELQRAALQSFVYRSWLGSEWDQPEKRKKGMRDLVATELRRFIANRELGEFLAAMTSHRTASSAGYRRLNPLSIFAEDFTRKALIARSENSPGQPGCIQLEWKGAGEWVLLGRIKPEDHQTSWFDWLENQLQQSPASQESLRVQTLQDETGRQVRAVPLSAYQQLKGRSTQDLLLGLVRAYKEKLEEAYHNQLLPDSEDQENLELVLRHLKRLTGN